MDALKAPWRDASRRDALIGLGVLVTIGAWLRVTLLLHDDGIYWPDEIYQSLEPAHRWVFGYGFVAWEFVRGARSWAFPGLVGALLFVCREAGVDSPGLYLAWIRSVFAVLGALSAVGVYRLARSFGAERYPSLGSAAAYCLGTVLVYFAPRAMSENASAFVVVWGLALALPGHAKDRNVAFGALLLGLSVMFRLHNTLFCGVLVGAWFLRRRTRPALVSLFVLGLSALGLGLLDWLTWGSWFHSAIEYLRFNFVEGRATQWGVAGPDYYVRALGASMPFLTLGLALLGGVGAVRRPSLAIAVALFLAAHSVTPHKELRFILPALPLLFSLAAVGASRLGRGPWKPAAAALLALAGVHSTFRAPRLTFGDLGQYLDEKPRASAYDDFGPINRLLSRAHTRADLCGLKVEGVHLAWTGGYSYLHRPVPMYGSNGPGRGSGFYNYVVTPRGWAREAPVVAEDGNFVLARLSIPSCEADPHFSWRLP